MTSELDPVASIEPNRDNIVRRPIVVIPVYNAPHETIACLESVLRHTPSNTRIVIVDDHGPDRGFFEHLANTPQASGRVEVIQTPENAGFVGACNLAFASTGSEDVILVNSDVVVGPEWFERMVAASQASPDVATVSVFTNSGTILSLPHRNSPCPEIVGGWSVDQAAERVARVADKSRPVIPTAVGHCVLITRRALNLVGGFDPIFGKGYGEEVDFSQRCLKVGLRHIVADDVFVFHKGSSSFTDAAKTQKDRNDALVAERYPWYLGSVQRASTDPYSPLATAINRASLQLRSPSIAFDGHCFASSWAGTQQTTFELIKAVARNRPAQEFTVIFSEHASSELIRRVTAEPNTRAEIVPNIMEDFSFRFDLIIRPHQVNSTEELRWMKRIANRTIVAQLDFISYSNPTYFADDHTWLSQRELTKLVHSSVDGVAWISEYVRQDAIKSGVRRPTALDAVIHCGTESSERSTKNPEPVQELSGVESPIITLFGVGYSHKSRPFALRVLAELARRGVDCHLVLAGQSPPFGSSMSEEEVILDGNPQLTERVTMLSALTDGQRDWLYARSSLVLYPSVAEGFGLVPFEAARHGTATLASRMGSLDEVLPTEIPTIDDFDTSTTANIVEQLLASPQKAASMAELIARRGADFTWDRTALATLDLIDRVLGGPRNNIDSVWGEGPEAAAVHGADYTERIRSKNRRAWLYRRVTASGVGRLLVGPPGSRRRGLLKVVYRRR